MGVAAFIGRGRDRAKVADLLAETRVVTLTGSGGCGKTRLAMVVSGDVAARFTDGVRWVVLQTVSEPGRVAPAVVEAVGVRSGSRVASAPAAARVRVLTPRQIAAGLSDRFGLLTGGLRGAPHRDNQ
ncbi:hypothetical protein [Cryobacterium sp. Y82]|uniref:hypothetical protein n=1 Tax=Cryobacterium sp. Y82 TaxID=2045017 RepID=UPI000CE329F5|nr:hypothetical protein [Cryobacterium sp. Y82]